MIDDSLPLTDAVGAGDETPAKGKRRFDEERRLEPWERYRVLTTSPSCSSTCSRWRTAGLDSRC
jgi:hypothetical protein